MPGKECDFTVVVGALIVFALPLTLLFPEFSLWDVVPKIQVTRFHIINLDITWSELNAGIITLLVCFFCLYLEIRKRKYLFLFLLHALNSSFLVCPKNAR